MFNKKIFIWLGIAAVLILAILFFIGLKDDTPPLEPPAPPVKKISVYVSGQVQNISVVELEDNGELRFIDAVNKAGGLTALADADAVNMAAPLADGQHIHIPSKEIFLQQQSSAAAGDMVNINTADAEKLATLKGIGPALAQRIIDYREQNGSFKSVDEIKNVRGIGDKKFAAFKDKITT